MNEAEIAKTVEAVLQELTTGSSNKPAGHQCTCKKKMTLAMANDLIEKVRAKAGEMGVAVVVAVSDAAGRPVSVQCMDEAFIASFDIALKKTYTAASLKMSTDELSRLSQPGAPLYGIQQTNNGQIVIFGGGEPLLLKDRIIGALGVSGGTAEQDTYLAAFGKEVFEEVV